MSGRERVEVPLGDVSFRGVILRNVQEVDLPRSGQSGDVLDVVQHVRIALEIVDANQDAFEPFHDEVSFSSDCEPTQTERSRADLSLRTGEAATYAAPQRRRIPKDVAESCGSDID